MVNNFTQDDIEYSYLFPDTNVPQIYSHPFDNINHNDIGLDKYVVGLMRDTNYFGWTCKVLFNIDLFPFQIVILQTLWDKAFPMLIAGRGSGKSFILAIYILLKAILDQGTKIVIVGAGLRQAKVVFNYIDTIWNDSSVLRSIVGRGPRHGPKFGVDSCYMDIGKSKIIALPLGDGTKIRGQRANVIIADEFSSIPSEIFDIVVRGFVATSKTPIDDAKRIAFNKKLIKIGIDPSVINKDKRFTGGNQIVFSGTAYYAFNHFAKRYDMWRRILKSNGDRKILSEIFGSEQNIPSDFNWKDYTIIRIPYTHIPDGLLDSKQLANAKATLPSSIFNMEYSAIFVKDSNGWFPRSLLESCTPTLSHGIITPDGEVNFSAMMNGVPGRKYVIGIDPARDVDNLAIVVQEIWDRHSRIVYCWSTNKNDFEKRRKNGYTEEKNYYAYCCRRIREILGRFPAVRIEMDSLGGGKAIAEMLRNKDLLSDGDKPIYEIIDPKDKKPTDGETDGPHILHLVSQTNEWNHDSNICMHRAFETKFLLFPVFDPLKVQASLIMERKNNIVVDSYEDCANEIEELKNEICTIAIQETPGGRPKFDTPSFKTISDGVTKKGRLRKDRYSALLISFRFVYDNFINIAPSIDYDDIVGNISVVNVDTPEGMYRGPGVGRMKNISTDTDMGFGAIKNNSKI